MGPRFKKSPSTIFPTERPHLLATYVKLKLKLPLLLYLLNDDSRMKRKCVYEIKHEISYLDISSSVGSGALFHTIALRSLLATTPEEELL